MTACRVVFRQTAAMTKHRVESIENMPVYLISEQLPWGFNDGDYISGVPLRELLMRLGPNEHLYLVDYASTPGQPKLTRLA